MEKILIYYKYIHIKNPAACAAEHRKICTNLGLKGRIFIAYEGINGTVGGPNDTTEQYKEILNSHPLFKGIDFKESNGDSDHFPRLQVTVKKQIVNFGIDPQEIFTEEAGTYLTPEQAHTLIKQNPDDLLLFDARNNYEWRIGTFEQATKPDISYFRELPQYIDEHLDQFKNKRVVMFCTAGIRCERATAYLKRKNVAQDVYHIKGGIQRYVEAYPDGYFRGKNYVFDGRVAVKITDDILAHCEHCKKPYDDYTNCINAACNKQIIVCPECKEHYHNTCSNDCCELVHLKKVPIRKVFRKLCNVDHT